MKVYIRKTLILGRSKEEGGAAEIERGERLSIFLSIF